MKCYPLSKKDSDGRGAVSPGGSGQHLAQISNDLKPAFTGRNHDMVDEPAQRLASGLAQLFAVLIQRRCELHRFLPKQLAHPRVKDWLWHFCRRRPDQRRKLRLARLKREQLVPD